MHTFFLDQTTRKLDCRSCSSLFASLVLCAGSVCWWGPLLVLCSGALCWCCVPGLCAGGRKTCWGCESSLTTQLKGARLKGFNLTQFNFCWLAHDWKKSQWWRSFRHVPKAEDEGSGSSQRMSSDFQSLEARSRRLSFQKEWELHCGHCIAVRRHFMLEQ